MLKSYIIIAWKVLKRNMLFTGISLFGISFALTILLVGESFLYNFTQSNYPAKNQNHLGYLIYIDAWNEKLDNGDYGKSYPISASFYLLDNYICSLQTPLKTSIYTRSAKTVNGLVNSKPIKVDIKYTDQEFWNILDFKFMYGRPYNKKEVDETQKLCVVSESLCNENFENAGEAIGKLIEAQKVNYTIIGVVKDVPELSISAYGNIWVPFTTSGKDLKEKTLSGDLTAMMLVRRKSDFGKLESELQQSLKRLDYPVGDIICIKTKISRQKDILFNNEYAPVHGPIMYAIFYLLVFTILLIPSLNLTTINTARIYERASEIGIRKSFGASKISLIYQFLVENLVLTMLGGLIALFLSIILLKIIEKTGFITVRTFPINMRMFLSGLGLCFLFGFVSGIIPARRMSKMPIVESLNENKP